MAGWVGAGGDSGGRAVDKRVGDAAAGPWTPASDELCVGGWSGDRFSDSSTIGIPHPPPGGYFWRKVLVFNGLHGRSGCKIFITNGLWLKYLLSMSWPRRISGAFLF